MDRQTQYVDQIPLATQQLLAQLYPFVGLANLSVDIFGTATAVSRLPCAPTIPASMAVLVGPGSIYCVQNLIPTEWGQRPDGAGGMAPDLTADHQVLKQGLNQATQSFSLAAPTGVGQTMIYLIEAQFQEIDAAAPTFEFYNSADPTNPNSFAVSPTRQNICALQAKAGIATTGTPVCPAADSGWVPVWAITVAYGQTSITAANIALAPGAVFVTIAAQTSGWATKSGAYTAQPGDKIIADTSNGPFTIKLPTSANPGTSVKIGGNFFTNNLTVDPQGQTIDGVTGTFTFNKDRIGAEFVWTPDHTGALKWWFYPAGALS